jgi:uncharacterized membrane protein
MLIKQVVAVLLIAAGALGLVYRQVSYTTKTHEANVAGIELSMKERETVAIPLWASGGAVAAGALLLLLGRRR